MSEELSTTETVTVVVWAPSMAVSLTPVAVTVWALFQSLFVNVKAVGDTTTSMGGSHFAELFPFDGIDLGLPSVDLEAGPKTARAVASAIASGSVLSAHDCSEGGMLVAAAEMAFSGGLGLSVELDAVHEDPLVAAFSETPGRYMLEVSPDHRDDVERHLDGIPCRLVGRFNGSGTLTTVDGTASIDALRAAWSGTIGW